MAASGHHIHNLVPMDTLITIKITVNDNLKKLKLPLRDLTANVLPDKLRHLLGIKPEQTVVFERFSDSAGGYITLDPNNPQVFKTLVRAAKAKLKLRLKATVRPEEPVQEPEAKPEEAVVEPTIVRTPVYQVYSRIPRPLIAALLAVVSSNSVRGVPPSRHSSALMMLRCLGPFTLTVKIPSRTCPTDLRLHLPSP
jgi:bifunctional DNA-binding transcriptional regulator/antitoxin component of YhaV-PrlF toxin-antitoxin module